MLDNLISPSEDVKPLLEFYKDNVNVPKITTRIFASKVHS